MGSALPNLGLPSKADIYAAALEGLVQVNDRILKRNPALLPVDGVSGMRGGGGVYGSGVRFKAIPHSNWRRADQIVTEGWGDCEGLSSWRTAELRLTGEDPDARVGVYHTGPRTYHAVVIRGNDDIEDPSVLLGLKPKKTAPITREEMNNINAHWPEKGKRWSITVGDNDTGTDDLTTDFVPLDDGSYAGQITIPLADPSQALIAQTSSVPVTDKVVAAAKTVNLLTDLAGTIKQNPMMLAQLNPYTAAAVMLYSQPDVKKALSTLGGGTLGVLKRIF